MNHTRVKICGLRRPEDVAFINEVHPDFAGFIFDPSRRRYIRPETAAALRARLAEGIQAVGVFVNAKPEQILRIVEEVSLDLIQLHGDEEEDYIKTLSEKTRIPVINALKVETEKDVERALSTCADLVLLDSGRGGTGTSFNWNLVTGFPRDYFLAGGISAENAADAIRQCHPWGLDASSSLETNGYKDQEKIRRFMEVVRNTDNTDKKE